MCIDDMIFYFEDWKDGYERLVFYNDVEMLWKSDKKMNLVVKEIGDEVKLDNELRVLYFNKKFDKFQSQDNEKKEKEL